MFLGLIVWISKPVALGGDHPGTDGKPLILGDDFSRRESKRVYVVYALVDPRDREPRYIGCTDRPYKRFFEHLKYRSDNPAKDAWILELRSQNYMVIMETLEFAELKQQGLELERYWIAHYQHLGKPLFNLYKNYSFSRLEVAQLPLLDEDAYFAQKEVGRLAAKNGTSDIEESTVVESVPLLTELALSGLSELERKVLKTYQGGITTCRGIALVVGGCGKDKVSGIIRSLKDRGFIEE